MEKEFIVWGVAPNQTEEQVLYTKCTNLDMANKCAAYLEKEKGCTKTRVQIIQPFQVSIHNQCDHL